MQKEKAQNIIPGDGIKDIKTTSVFRMVNFELYVKPVSYVDFI